MIKKLCCAAAAFALVSAPAAGQEEPSRYDRALAAGYKALMLCGAGYGAQRSGKSRTQASINTYELTGIQAPLNGIVAGLPVTYFHAEPGSSDMLAVGVSWADDMPPRIAFRRPAGGCSAAPIGMTAEQVRALRPGAAAARYLPPAAHTPLPSNASRLDGRTKEALTLNAFSDLFGAGARTTGILIAEKGAVVHEEYAADFGPHVPQRTWSVAKSIAATLIGAAVQRGEVDINVPANIAQWQGAGDPRRAITIDHLLRMASGRYSDTAGNRTDPIYWGGATVDERAVNWPAIHAPGTTYRYANNDTLLAIKAIAPSLAANPPADFFRALGMRNTVAETDWQGNYILSSQVWSSPRDLARLGLLYLNDGIWNGKRILPENWRAYVSAASGPQPQGRPLGYGAGFWLFNAVDGIPPDTIAAMGNRGQYIVIVPSRDVVIVRRGEDPAGQRFDIAGFTREVLSVLEE